MEMDDAVNLIYSIAYEWDDGYYEDDIPVYADDYPELEIDDDY